MHYKVLTLNVTGSAKTLHVRIQGNMVERSVSVQKFPRFIMVQRNQKSVVLSGLYSCFCEDV